MYPVKGGEEKKKPLPLMWKDLPPQRTMRHGKAGPLQGLWERE